MNPSILDEIGPWSERKHGIVQDYAEVYSLIMSQAQKSVAVLSHDYIDGYASAGYSVRRGSGDIIKGTALNSLEIQPPFAHFTFVELNAARYSILKNRVKGTPNVEVIHGDANVVLPHEVIPRYTYENFRRAFCLLDPHNHKELRWQTIADIGKTRAIDLLVHFPTMTMNRGVLHRGGAASPDEAKAMTLFWGDESWREAVYVKRPGLLEGLPAEKATDLAFASAFCARLKNVAGFKDTTKPIPMKNTRGAVVYYLIFALPHPTAVRAAKSVAKYFIEYPTAVRRSKRAERRALVFG